MNHLLKSSMSQVHASSSIHAMPKQEKHVVTLTHVHKGSSQPLFELIMTLRPDESKTQAKRSCRRGEVVVDGLPPESPSVDIKEGQVIQCLARNGASAMSETNLLQVAKHLLPLLHQMNVAYEDEHMAVVVKPPGIATQGKGDGLRGFLPHILKPTTEIGALHRPQHCHRLDLDTGGLLVVAKTKKALSKLSEDFATGGIVKKTYQTIVKGEVIMGKGIGDRVLDKALRGRECQTLLLERGRIVTRSVKYGCLTTLLLQPYQGRKHQIRRHCSEVLKTPILGDKRYGGWRFDKGLEEQDGGHVPANAADDDEEEEDGEEAGSSGTRGELLSDGETRVTMCLWAVEISLLHPITRDRLEIKLPGGEPDIYRAIREKEELLYFQQTI